jgi:hypothetical protein
MQRFKFVEQQEFETIINDPLIMVPSLDEKMARRIPP